MSATVMDAAVPRPALELSHLEVSYRVRGREQRVIRDLSLRLAPGESFGLVGESGCGKSTAALAIVRYLARNGHVGGGSIEAVGRQVLNLSRRQLREYRAHGVSMVYQEPGKALNPSLRIGRQLEEVFALAGIGRREAQARAAQALADVQIADPDEVLGLYPHQLSGGMLQRVLIGMAVASRPQLLILDEPTTALDTTVEAEVLEMIAALREQLGMTLLLISHNLGIVARMCDRVGVLYAGELVELGTAQEVLRAPQHPYTAGLLRAIPTRQVFAAGGRVPLATIPGAPPEPGQVPAGCAFAPRCPLAQPRCREQAPPLYDLDGGRLSRCHFHEQVAGAFAAADRSRVETVTAAADGTVLGAQPLLRARHLSKTFTLGGRNVRALADVDIDLWPGETVGLVGESGSGKTTLARVLVGLTAPAAGAELELDGHALAPLSGRRQRDDRRALQLIFQNPDSALNRRHSVARMLSRSLAKLGGYRGAALARRRTELLGSVQLSERHLPLKPGQLSGGLKQRVAIARAFAGDPRIVICDEPTSALDVSVQATILNLLAEMQRARSVSYLLISHDLGVVRYLADRIVVLYLGRVMESGTAEQVFMGPHHPYTAALLSAVPTLDGRRPRIRLRGEIPSASAPPSGCPFQTRCPRKLGAICETTEPPLRMDADGHGIRCHIPTDELVEPAGGDSSEQGGG
jgi:peptide/nickel transport system ATP-binding protein